MLGRRYHEAIRQFLSGSRLVLCPCGVSFDLLLRLDCNTLHAKLTGSYTDGLSIVHILCNRDVSQRLEIRDRYRTMFHEVSAPASSVFRRTLSFSRLQELREQLKSVDNASLRKILRVLLLSPVEYDCYEIRRMCKERLQDESILLEICLARSMKHIRLLSQTYQRCK